MSPGTTSRAHIEAIMRTTRGYRRLLTAAVGAIALLSASSTARASAREPTPGVIPPQGRAHGMTYGEWSAAWWQWALSLPVDKNPFFDEGGDCTNGSNGQRGPVWFLTGVLNESGTAVRDCVVPAGKALFFPVINVECSTLEDVPFHGEDEAELRACATGFAFGEVSAKIDGVPIQDLDRHLVESPLFEFTLPEENVLGIDPGTGQSVSNGYYLLLAPLSVGEHVVEFGGTYTDFGFSLHITYNLTVAPRTP
jgi:hypothetical protein